MAAACVTNEIPESAAGGDSASEANGDGSGSGSGTSGAGGKFECCLNMVGYACPDKASFDKCAGFDMAGCLDACGPMDFDCMDGCHEKLGEGGNDPSDCQQSEAVTCSSSGGGSGTGSGGGLCVGDWDGNNCDLDSDCSSGNCTDDKCYGNSVGNPCELDSDCDSGNCTNSCCYGNASGDPCKLDSDCDSGNCYSGVCQ